MVAATSAGGLLIALTARGSDEPWASITIPLLLVAVGALANILTASSVRAAGGPHGGTVRCGVVGWPRSTYPPDEIEQAEVVDLPWWRVSWGYRWTPKSTNCTVRSGPTLRLVLRSGRTVVITVPDPAAAVAAIAEPPARHA